MGLKKISSRHLDIIRRLIVGQTMQEICIDLGISQSRISILKADPLFASVYYEMENKVTEGFIETRANAMEILEDAAPHAARLTRDAIFGEIDGEEVPQALRMKSAWDCLDRTGNKGVDKHLVGHIDLGELIGKAYTEKHGGRNDFERAAKAKAEAEDVTDVESEAVNSQQESGDALASATPANLSDEPLDNLEDENLAVMVMEDYAAG